ncbi:MAG: DUF2793 domain-containing protein [Rickettsia endosymbiont of Labidopullus appendiculatus]|nr:DUF2793 domain-containing protein [Rickettsia endosymbiont of Labidopullus appendiculatus]
MSCTARLKLPLIHSGQMQKEITHNEALSLLDILINPVVQAIGITSPEIELDNQKLGQLYIIGANAEQEFIGHENNIAQKLEHGWRFIIPHKWQEVVLDDDGSHYRFDGEKWQKS